jgi:hypothetical protein
MSTLDDRHLFEAYPDSVFMLDAESAILTGKRRLCDFTASTMTGVHGPVLDDGDSLIDFCLA